MSAYIALCLALRDYERLLGDNAIGGDADMQRKAYTTTIGPVTIAQVTFRPATIILMVIVPVIIGLVTI